GERLSEKRTHMKENRMERGLDHAASENRELKTENRALRDEIERSHEERDQLRDRFVELAARMERMVAGGKKRKRGRKLAFLGLGGRVVAPRRASSAASRMNAPGSVHDEQRQEDSRRRATRVRLRRDPGHQPQACRRGIRLSRSERPTSRRPGNTCANPRTGGSPSVEECLDLPERDGPPPGHRPGRPRTE